MANTCVLTKIKEYRKNTKKICRTVERCLALGPGSECEPSGAPCMESWVADSPSAARYGTPQRGARRQESQTWRKMTTEEHPATHPWGINHRTLHT